MTSIPAVHQRAPLRSDLPRDHPAGRLVIPLFASGLHCGLRDADVFHFSGGGWLAGAVTLTADGRRTVIQAWERRMTAEIRHPLFGYEVSYRRAAELQARVLAAHLLGELPAYEPLVTR